MKQRKQLKVDPKKLLAWKVRSILKVQENARRKIKTVKRAPQRSNRRRTQETVYNARARDFILRYPVCPVTGRPASQVHHSAKRDGDWLLLQRYWIAVSLEGHQWIENNKTEAEKLGLMVRIRLTCEQHCAKLLADGESLSEPLFYKTWNGQPLVNEIC